jgi:hypothetical protein
MIQIGGCAIEEAALLCAYPVTGGAANEKNGVCLIFGGRDEPVVLYGSAVCDGFAAYLQSLPDGTAGGY